jgi:hypothetical protein
VPSDRQIWNGLNGLTSSSSLMFLAVNMP